MQEKYKPNSSLDGNAQQLSMPFPVLNVVPPEALDSMMKASVRAQGELTTLVGRRTRAWVEASSRAADYRSLQDVARFQMEFWQTAWQQYAETGQRIADAWKPLWGGMLPMQWPHTSLGWSSSTATPVERDVLSVPEEAATTARPSERRAA